MLNDLNGVLLNYSINYSGIEIDTVPRVIYLSNLTLTNQSIILTNLEEYTTYSINVSAYTKVGRGPDAVVSQRTNQDGELLPNSISFYSQLYANECAFLTIFILHCRDSSLFLFSTVPSAIPTNFEIRAISPTIVNVSWTLPTIYHQNGIITIFTLTYKGVERDASLRTIIIPVMNGTDYVLPTLIGLEENTNYVVTVRASTVVGYGPVTTLTVLTPQNGKFYHYCFIPVMFLSH